MWSPMARMFCSVCVASSRVGDSTSACTLRNTKRPAKRISSRQCAMDLSPWLPPAGSMPAMLPLPLQPPLLLPPLLRLQLPLPLLCCVRALSALNLQPAWQLRQASSFHPGTSSTCHGIHSSKLRSLSESGVQHLAERDGNQARLARARLRLRNHVAALHSATSRQQRRRLSKWPERRPAQQHSLQLE